MAEQLVNVHDLVGRCPFATSQKLLAGKWSLLIMHELLPKLNSYSLLYLNSDRVLCRRTYALKIDFGPVPEGQTRPVEIFRA